jgi:hypothetical protein
MGDLAYIDCPKCRQPAKEILNYEMGKNGTRVGWWCVPCNHFEDAVLREKTITPRVPGQDGSHNARL